MFSGVVEWKYFFKVRLRENLLTSRIVLKRLKCVVGQKLSPFDSKLFSSVLRVLLDIFKTLEIISSFGPGGCSQVSLVPLCRLPPLRVFLKRIPSSWTLDPMHEGVHECKFPGSGSVLMM